MPSEGLVLSCYALATTSCAFWVCEMRYPRALCTGIFLLERGTCSYRVRCSGLPFTDSVWLVPVDSGEQDNAAPHPYPHTTILGRDICQGCAQVCRHSPGYHSMHDGTGPGCSIL